MNYYQFQKLASVFCIVGIFSNISYNMFFILTSGLFFLYPFIDFSVSRVYVFFLIGVARSFFIPTLQEEYSYKYTTFEAEIVDFQVRPKGDYLLLKNFKYNNSLRKGESDKFPIFPTQALMKVDDINLFKNVKKIRCFGRFFLPINTFASKRYILPKGIIKEFEVSEYSKNTSFKNYFRKKFDAYLSKQASSFAKAVFLADTFCIDLDTRKTFQKAGVAHLLGVSILNLSILLFILYYLFYFLIGKLCLRSAFYIPLGISSKIISIVFIMFYCYLVGFEYPLLRTLLMSSLSILTVFFKSNNSLESLFLSAAFILLLFPEAIFDLSFQLSFGGVLGIYAFSKNWNNSIISMLYVTLSACSVIIPISIYSFQEVSLQPFLANLIIIPFLTFIIIPILLLFMTLSYFSIASYIANLLNFLFKFMFNITLFLSNYGCNIHFKPIDSFYLIFFIGCFVFFSVIKERIRYIFLLTGSLYFSYGLYISHYHKPFVLISLSGVALIDQEKVVMYPRCNFMGMSLSETYNVPCVDAKGGSLIKKDACGKIIVNNKLVIVRKEMKKSFCKIDFSDHIITDSDLMKSSVVLKLDR